MTLRAIPLLALSCSLAAQGALIYSNGPVITDPSGGFGGAPISVLQKQAVTANPPGLGHTIVGYGAQSGAGNSCADDFATNGPWTVAGIEVFGYATGSVVASATDVRLQIYMGGAPGAGGVPLVDTNGNGLPGNAINLFTLPGPTATTVGVFAVSNTLTGTYRVLDAPPANLLSTTRALQSVRVNLAPPLLLPAGVYWLQLQYSGISFCPPVTTNCVNSTGDAIQNIANSAIWTPLLNGTGGVGLPFQLYGTSTSAPASSTSLGGGCGTVTLAVDGSFAVGGYVRAQLGNFNPILLPLIAVDLATPGSIPWPGCSCLVRFTSSWVPFLQSHLIITVPMDPNLVGLDLLLQGGQVDFLSLAPCVVAPGFNFELTNGYRVHLY